MLVMACGIAVAYPFLTSSRITAGSPIWLDLGPIEVYRAGVIYGAATALRLYAIYSVTLMFVMTTDPADFIRAMIQQWKLQDRFGYATLAVFRFIPDLRRELEAVRAAHFVRGMGGTKRKGSLVERLRRYMVPLLAAAIRRAERTSYAMDARGIGSRRVRTYYRQFSFRARDWFFLAAYWLISLAVIMGIAHAGLLGRLSFMKMFG
ncbi:hypothetical protein GCM10008018_62440 [Paenibacillus marchantiophytorum]|uniref:Energy-coupling factor transporter transmembrane protein EcfT n=1 Tax=Paenibacillus marchantiophytorum TaxID=1619310 RepID=A0ABQ1FE46_9BACL|nr:energy-coupling factor transporter transmembrane component T [Paenibacillus marchantiophytorum]GGA08270.1 hypothetical protein GCM10008018_62440 [Paenibacillus marchantiophytorum]